MALPSLKAMNLTEKLTMEVVGDVAKFKQWNRKLEHWVSTQANPPSIGAKMEQFFKKIWEATQ